MPDVVEERVFALISDFHGVKRSKMFLHSTLSHDLGMEGDDAVEFFQEFQKEFAVDLRTLWEDWYCYFTREGMPLATGLSIFVPTVMVGFLLNRLLPQIPVWLCCALGFVLSIFAMFCWGRFVGKAPEPQITVQDLVDCAHAGKWNKQVPENLKAKLAIARGEYSGTGRWFAP
jgi:hypothetical protein